VSWDRVLALLHLGLVEYIYGLPASPNRCLHLVARFVGDRVIARCGSWQVRGVGDLGQLP